MNITVTGYAHVIATQISCRSQNVKYQKPFKQITAEIVK
jgi:hypothetical protein